MLPKPQPKKLVSVEKLSFYTLKVSLSTDEMCDTFIKSCSDFGKIRPAAGLKSYLLEVNPNYDMDEVYRYILSLEPEREPEREPELKYRIDIRLSGNDKEVLANQLFRVQSDLRYNKLDFKKSELQEGTYYYTRFISISPDGKISEF